ncbi:membrane-bound lytic murein transglycosylase D [compost metagenome]
MYHLLNEEEIDVNKHVVLASNDRSMKSRSVSLASKATVVYHKVTSGQNLSIIADKYNVEVQDLKVWNGLKGSGIVPGQKLKIYRKAVGKGTPRSNRT